MHIAPTPPAPTFSELDAYDGLASTVAVAPPRAMPTQVVQPAANPRRRSPLLLLLLLLIVSGLAVAAVIGALHARDAVFTATRTFDAAKQSGFIWSVARASAVPLGVAAAVIGVIWLALFGRRRRGFVLPAIVLLLLFALPAGVLSGAAYLASRRDAVPGETTDAPPGAEPSLLPELTVAPVATAAPSASPVPGDDGDPSGVGGFVVVPAAPVAPAATGMQSQSQGTQHQSG